MKKRLLLCLLAFGTLSLLTQDLPQNPEPGKCYVRCTTPDI
ncbi:MAG: OmpA family protein, partial [Flavobacteriia bacterium]|nr:OmpA family protein [Flavobacteriia bacterium]